MYTVITIKSKFLSVLSTVALLINQLFLVTSALAQEATPSAVLSPSIENHESSSSALVKPPPSPTPILESSPTVSPIPLWIEDNSVYTTETLRKDVTYKFPTNEKVSLTFSKLPQNSGTATVKEIKLTQEQIKETRALSDIAYEITSTMQGGTFEYSLTLPIPTNKNVEVKYSEDGQNFADITGEKTEQDIVTITGLTHFTIFVVAGTISSGNSTSFDESNATVVINEFVFNPSDGNDWVELYNRGSSTVNLAGWKLDDSTSTMVNLSGSLLPGGFLVFEVSNRLNAASSGDRIELKNATGDLIDQVSYKDSNTTINGSDNVGSIEEGESVGRTNDGVISGDVWTTYTSPTKGYNNSGDTTFITVGENYGYTSIQNALDNIQSGGTVHVLPSGPDDENGESLEINQSLTLIGDPGDSAAGPGEDAPTIYGDCFGDPVISVYAENVTVSGFNVIEDGCDGSNIYIDGFTSGATISDNELSDASYYGVEISSISSDNQILRNSIHDNEDYGIYNNGATNTTISNNDIYNNNGGIGMGGRESNGSDVSGTQITNNDIHENYNTGIYVGDVTFSDLTISNNSSIDSNQGYGIYFEVVSDTELTISDNIVTNNESTGIYLAGGCSVCVNNSVVTTSGNTISSNSGDGLYADVITSSTFNVIDNTIENNDSNGIYICSEGECVNSTVTIDGNEINNNGLSGISLYEILNGSTMTISDNHLEGNAWSAFFGSALYIDYIYNSTVEITGNDVWDHSWTGIYINRIEEGAIGGEEEGETLVTISENNIEENNGYGIYMSEVSNSDVTIGEDNTISDNSNAGIYLNNNVSGVSITGNTITGNGLEEEEGEPRATGIVVNNAEGNQAHLNKITGNIVGIQNNDEENAFDARENWWGSSSGPEGEGADSIGGNVLFQPWYTTNALTNLDSTAPTIAINFPAQGATLTSSVIILGTTNEAATCTYNLDGGSSSAMDATGSTSHTKAVSGLSVGSHTVRLSCIDTSGNLAQSSLRTWNVLQSSGNSLPSTGSDLIFSSATDGQVDLPSGITTLTLNDTTIFDVRAGLKTASGNNITIGGVVKDLSSFTSGDLVGQNLSGIQSIGGVSFEIEKAVTLQSGTNGQPIFLTNADLSGVNVSIPDGAAVLAPNGWSGTIQPPKTSSGSGIAPSGFSVGSTVIEIGSPDIVLLFDNPVTVALTGVTGPVGYKPAGSTTWTQITNTCGGTYTSPTSPTFPGECAISDGTNTKIVTYHFTSFAALNIVSSASTPTSSTSGNSLSAASAPSCNDTKPGNAPTLISAVGGLNSVTLTWNKATNPVTYYLATYGTGAGLQQYGNPNVGGSGTTTYTIQGLSGGTTYYFKVRAGNGCAPGDFSNELSAFPTGVVVSSPAAGFSEGVLGVSTNEEFKSPEEQGENEGEVKGEGSEEATQREEGSVDKRFVDVLRDNWIWVLIGLLAVPTVIYLIRRK